jgi:hypothetical protein
MDKDELISLCVEARSRAKIASKNLDLAYDRQSKQIVDLIANATRLLRDLSANGLRKVHAAAAATDSAA